MPFVITAWPHLKEEDTTAAIMRAVCYALAPVFVWALFVFGWYSWAVAATCVAACLATEAVCQRLRGVPVTLGDWSAVVSGLLLAAVLPPNLPLWLAALGGAFAMGVAKHAFGGLGANIWNPALLARAFLQNTRPDAMMAGSWPWLSIGPRDDWWMNPFRSLRGSFTELNAAARDMSLSAADSITGATSETAAVAANALQRADLVTGATASTAVHFPVSLSADSLPSVLTPDWSAVLRTWVGIEGGCIGEVSAVLLLLGGLYLLARKVITWEIPVFYLGSAALLSWALPMPFKVGEETLYSAWFSGPWFYQLGAGGLMLGALFMATDMVTRPLTRSGQIVFALGCGVLTVAIRSFAGYPEGVCYAILIMNTCVPWIDAFTRPRVYGKKRQAVGR